MRPPSVSASSSDSILVRLLRGILLLGLSLLISLLLGLALLTQFPILRAAVDPLFVWSNPVDQTAGWLTLAFIIGTPILLLVVARLLHLRSCWWIAGGYLTVAPVLAYLAIDDDALLYPLSIEELAPPFPGAEASYAVLMQYSKQTPSDEATAFSAQKFRLVGQPVGPDKPAEWIDFLQTNRTDLEADWADLAPQRRWLNELNAFDRISDLGTDQPDANIITFQVWRLLSQRTAAQASLQALDGHGDEAIATLLPLLEASRKIQPSARTLVRCMIAIVVEKLTTNAALFILDHADVSPASRARLAAALTGGVRGETGARRLIAVEYSMQLGSFLRQPIGNIVGNYGLNHTGSALRHSLNLISPFVYNPVRTFNLMGQVNRAQQDLAAARYPISGTEAETQFRAQIQPHFKNFFGTILVANSTPAYAKIVDSYWKLHDLREALAARLQPNN